MIPSENDVQYTRRLEEERKMEAAADDEENRDLQGGGREAAGGESSGAFPAVSMHQRRTSTAITIALLRLVCAVNTAFLLLPQIS